LNIQTSGQIVTARAGDVYNIININTLQLLLEWQGTHCQVGSTDTLRQADQEQTLMLKAPETMDAQVASKLKIKKTNVY
jgi:hypothetical protein